MLANQIAVRRYAEVAHSGSCWQERVINSIGATVSCPSVLKVYGNMKENLSHQSANHCQQTRRLNLSVSNLLKRSEMPVGC